MKQHLGKPPTNHESKFRSRLHACAYGAVARSRITLLALGCSLASGIYAATTITVTNTADTGPDTPAAGSLRAALASAVDGDTIDARGITGTITLMFGATSSAELVVNKNVAILGPGPSNLTVDANHLSRVFFITPGHTVTIDGLAIVNGLAFGSPDGGGGIYNNHSALTVSNCILSGNSARAGGGIFNDGASSGSAALTVNNCTLSGNSAGLYGGGIFNDGTSSGDATLVVIASTLSGNSAHDGGGIDNEIATLTVIISTLSGNSTDAVFGYGGGILTSSGRVDISSSTLSGNSAAHGSSISNVSAAKLEIGNTILRAGGPDKNIYVQGSGTITSLGFNLSSDDGSGFLTAPNDQKDIDPMLGPLADNGGPTLTHMLLPGSPAIDGGSSDALVAFGITTDQRGFPRTVDDPAIPNAFLSDGTDIGAVEVGGAAPPPPVNHADLLVSLGVNKTSVKQGDELTYTITVHNFGPDAAANVVVNDTLSSGTTFVSAHANKGNFTTPSPNQTGVVSWNIGDLSNGDAEGAQLEVKVIVKGKTTITNVASVSTTSDDPNPANNSAAITTTVAAGGGSGKK